MVSVILSFFAKVEIILFLCLVPKQSSQKWTVWHTFLLKQVPVLVRVFPVRGFETRWFAMGYICFPFPFTCKNWTSCTIQGFPSLLLGIWWSELPDIVSALYLPSSCQGLNWLLFSEEDSVLGVTSIRNINGNNTMDKIWSKDDYTF